MEKDSTYEIRVITNDDYEVICKDEDNGQFDVEQSMYDAHELFQEIFGAMREGRDIKFINCLEK